MSDNNEESRKYFGGFLDESVHAAMVDISSVLGKRPFIFAELCVIEGIKAAYQREKKKGTELPVSVVLAVRQMELNERRNNRMIVQQMAYDYMEFPSEARLEELQEAAALVGSTVAEEIEAAQKSAHVMKLMEESGGKLSKAELWLAQNMTPGVPYDARAILEDAAQQCKFSEATINRAKAKLPISSEKNGKHWTWTFNAAGSNPF